MTLRPPPESASIKRHWLRDANNEAVLAEWHDESWFHIVRYGEPMRFAGMLPDTAIDQGYRYYGSCSPASRPDPENEADVELVARAICKLKGRDPDAPRWFDMATKETMGICWHENIDTARAVLKALRDRKECGG